MLEKLQLKIDTIIENENILPPRTPPYTVLKLILNSNKFINRTCKCFKSVD